MGRSLTVTVFYGARLLDPENEGPHPRLREGVGKNWKGPPLDEQDRCDLYELERAHPLIDCPRSGEGDYTIAHIAIKASVLRSDYEPVSLEGILSNILSVDPTWTPALRAAMADLEWYTGWGDEKKIVPAPDLEIGWFACASYF
jgi:hypothetical protein